MKLYRHFDSEGRLLYVGIARDPITRLQQHNGSSHWADEIAMITIEAFTDKAAAREAEARAIHNEQPLYNKMLRYPTSTQCAHYGARDNADLDDLLASARTGLSRQYVNDLIEARKRLQMVRLQDLEAACGISRQHLWNIRQGRQKPSFRVLDAVLEGLDRLDEAEREAQ